MADPITSVDPPVIAQPPADQKEYFDKCSAAALHAMIMATFSHPEATAKLEDEGYRKWCCGWAYVFANDMLNEYPKGAHMK